MPSGSRRPSEVPPRKIDLIQAIANIYNGTQIQPCVSYMPTNRTRLARESRNRMRVIAGQDWELPNANSDDPLVLRVVEVHDNWAEIHVIQHSKPDVIIRRSTMHCRDVIDTGVLVAGPGASAAQARHEEISHLSGLLLFAARKTGVTAGGNVRFDGEEVIDCVKADLGISRDDARALIRGALPKLGGSETWRSNWESTHDQDVIYVIPATQLHFSSSGATRAVER